MIFSGNDFRYINFGDEYAMYSDKYYALRSNSKSVFANSTWVISTVQKLIEAKAKETKLMPYGPGDLFPLSDFWE